MSDIVSYPSLGSSMSLSEMYSSYSNFPVKCQKKSVARRCNSVAQLTIKVGMLSVKLQLGKEQIHILRDELSVS